MVTNLHWTTRYLFQMQRNKLDHWTKLWYYLQSSAVSHSIITVQQIYLHWTI